MSLILIEFFIRLGIIPPTRPDGSCIWGHIPHASCQREGSLCTPSVESWIAASGTGMTCLLQASGKEGESRRPDPGWGLPLQILRFAQNDRLLEPASVALVFESVQGVLGGACS